MAPESEMVIKAGVLEGDGEIKAGAQGLMSDDGRSTSAVEACVHLFILSSCL